MAQRGREGLEGRHPWTKDRYDHVLYVVEAHLNVFYRARSDIQGLLDVTPSAREHLAQSYSSYQSIVNHVQTSLARQAYNLDEVCSLSLILSRD
jgi:hypothetical protein